MNGSSPSEKPSDASSAPRQNTRAQRRRPAQANLNFAPVAELIAMCAAVAQPKLRQRLDVLVRAHQSGSDVMPELKALIGHAGNIARQRDGRQAGSPQQTERNPLRAERGAQQGERRQQQEKRQQQERSSPRAERSAPRPLPSPSPSPPAHREAIRDRASERTPPQQERVHPRQANADALAGRITFDETLPVVARRVEIAKAIAAHQVVVVCGETGSGKSTQLPKILLEMGRGVAGMIGHTQPRRIAARSVATRVAEELGTELDRPGGPIGFKVRFTDGTHGGTMVKVMTDGILLAETQSDRQLRKYDTIIIDEAHERTLNIDFLLGYLRRILPQRPDLKIIITSATIDPERLSAHFGGPEQCPIITVSGRTYPVDVEYRPLKLPGTIRDMSDPEFDEDALEESLEHAVVATVGELFARSATLSGERTGGDVLVFLPGEREIRDCQQLLAEAGYDRPGRGHDSIEIVPLYARLPAGEQMRIFKPGVGRRVVLATNVAETSITVPGVRYVIDSGLARISRYTVRSRVQRLPIEKISQASAKQRSGRCGRIGPGVCVRLYDEADFNARPAFTDPEILRDSLASVILQMLHLRLGDIEQFPFVEPPEARQIKDGYETLSELGAVDDALNLTPMGAAMARLPIDPRVSRMVLAGADEGCLSEMLVLASALSVQDPRERPMDQAQLADARQAIFRDETSDFLGLLRLWTWFEGKQRTLTGGKLRKLCREHFVSFVRLREWRDVQRQLTDMLGPMQARVNAAPAKPEAIHRAVLAGLLSFIGTKTDTHEYMGARSVKFSIFPGSGIFKKQPKWVVSAELVRTTKLYARCNAAVTVEAIERIGKSLMKFSHFDPHYDERAEKVMAYEKGTLFGLELYGRRRVPFHEQDPALARDLFIRAALVEGQMQSSGPFVDHNSALMQRANRLQTRLRRSDLIADDSVRYDFYDRHVPAGISAVSEFERWRLDVEKHHPMLLYFSQREVLTEQGQRLSDADFPDTLDLGGVIASLRYLNDPTSPADGITAQLSLEALAAVPEHAGTWLVPGWHREKIEALIRSLPRGTRTAFVPIPHWSARVLAEIERAKLTSSENYTIEQAAAQALTALAENDVPVTARSFDMADLPPHLFLSYSVADAAGHELARGKSVSELRRDLASKLTSMVESLTPDEYRRDGLTGWDFGDLPAAITLSAGRGSDAVSIAAYPALYTTQGRVGLCVRASAPIAAHDHRQGLRRLFVLAARDVLEAAIKQTANLDALRLLHSTIGTAQVLHNSLLARTAEACFLNEDSAVRSKAEFESRLARLGKPQLVREQAERIVKVVSTTLSLVQSTLLQLEKFNTPVLLASKADIKEQLDELLPHGFLATAPWPWMMEYPRYLQAIQIRIRKALLPGGLAREESALIELRPRIEAFAMAIRAAHAEGIMLETPPQREYRWMLEEFRVQLFAQDLGTKVTVSGKRLDTLWLKII